MSYNIKHSNIEDHKKSIHEMSKFFESDNPQIGIFWLDTNNMSLFGVNKGDADLYDNGTGYYTYPKLHKTFWQKQHFKAVATNNKSSIFFIENNYTNIPRGRIFVDHDTYVVKVGEWINDIDIDKFSELIEDEFNISNFIFDIDKHWNIGHGWSEEKF